MRRSRSTAVITSASSSDRLAVNSAILANRRCWTLDTVFELFPVLQPLRNRQGGFLSGGEQQMLTIARTLMGNPELLLLDEPSEGLAPLVVEALLANVRELKNQGLTILLAEQGVDFSLALADRVYVLERGAVRHSSPAAELRDNHELRDRLLAL